jgi:hypothetical protein
MLINENQGRWDAETLAEAKSIEKDPIRLQKAQEAAQKLADEQRDRANFMSAVARKQTKRRIPQTNSSNTPKVNIPKVNTPKVNRISSGSGSGSFNVFKRLP